MGNLAFPRRVDVRRDTPSKVGLFHPFLHTAVDGWATGRWAAISARASVAYFTSWTLRKGPKLRRVVPPRGRVPMAA
jgi:hypothetical protein